MKPQVYTLKRSEVCFRGTPVAAWMRPSMQIAGFPSWAAPTECAPAARPYTDTMALPRRCTGTRGPSMRCSCTPEPSTQYTCTRGPSMQCTCTRGPSMRCTYTQEPARRCSDTQEPSRRCGDIQGGPGSSSYTGFGQCHACSYTHPICNTYVYLIRSTRRVGGAVHGSHIVVLKSRRPARSCVLKAAR